MSVSMQIQCAMFPEMFISCPEVIIFHYTESLTSLVTVFVMETTWI
jgi:hypothetical protein